jgi:hypothetical protein
MSKPTTPIVLTVGDWNPSAVRYTQPKVNDRGGKSINIISSQTGRWLHISTPLMMTWGVSDYVDEKGESDGKFSITLNFPNSDYATAGTSDFLDKLKAFENQILDDAVKNSEAWFGEEMSREVAKHTFFPFIKYSKDKVTKKIDLTKPPSIRAKVPNYNNRWAVEIYDTASNMLFPCDNDNLTPIDFIPKKSNVACVLQCGGLWFGGKGWGVTWKLNQCIVKPQETQSVFGKCHVQLSLDELRSIESQPVANVAVDEDDMTEEGNVETPAQVSTVVDDSDDEDAAVEEPLPEVVAAPVKKVVKKVAAESSDSAVAVQAEEPVAAVATEPAKKKVVKKKVVA